MRYLGHLQRSDPLYDHLYFKIFIGELGITPDKGFRVFALNGSNAVYLYEDRRHQRRVLGKFFDRHSGHNNAAAAQHEFQVLSLLHGNGLGQGQHRVVEPLGVNPDFADVLFECFVLGEPLHRIWARSLPGHDDQLMYHSLSDLAYFLARLHNHNVRGDPVRFVEIFPYFDKIIARLWRRGRARQQHIDQLYYLRHLWENDGAMYSDHCVRLHGDATPANFLVTGHHQLTAIDFERSHFGDRVYDLGMITGELKHWALRQHGDASAAENYIGHFLWEYSRHFPHQPAAFQAITHRLPFYMGLTLLRIARNSYLGDHYAHTLIHEAIACLGR
ncbi:aminoglycoside phosphotransferase family protein [Acidithiobacillus sp. IBUN Pt1247-S3]|uniref:aminoglycoside phosphotransferase family protein n=1 Tax=Acidithiobacillus sp. IBUN Pt1247-S3 TaxID=3166642 RepID=UPI0034E5D289